MSSFLQFYVILSFVSNAKFTVMPLVDVQDIVVESQNLKCEFGCHEGDKIGFNKFKCFKVDDGQSFGSNVVAVGDQKYQCITDVKLPEKIMLKINKFVCKFSDEENKLLNVDSCFASYRLLKVNQEGSIYDTLIWCSLVLILILLCFLGTKEYFKDDSKHDEWQLENLTGQNDPINDIKETKVVQDDECRHGSRRQEVLFKQGHSFISDRRRARSRSRRR